MPRADAIALDTGAAELPSRGRGGTLHVSLTIFGIVAAAGLFFAHYYLNWLGTSSTLVFALALGGLLLPLVFIDPIHGLMVYAVVAPISPEAQIGTFDLTLRVQDPLTAVILLGVIFRVLRYGVSRTPTKLLVILSLYIIYAIVATLLAYITKALPHDSPDPRHVFKTAQYAVLAVCVAYSVRTSAHAWMLLTAIAVGLLLQPLQFGIAMYGEDVGVKLSGEPISEQANVLSVYLAVAICAVLGCADRVRNKIMLVILLAVLAIAGYTLLRTLSRTGYIAGTVVLLGGFVVMRRKWIPLVALMAVVVKFVDEPHFVNRLQTIGAVIGIGEDHSYTARLVAYDEIWTRVVASWQGLWFGGGRGVKPLMFADTQWGTELLYGGITGLAIAIFLVVISWGRSVILWRAAKRRTDGVGAAAVACVLGISAAAISTFGLPSWSAIRTAEIIFLLLGLMMAAQRIIDEERGVGVPVPVKREKTGRVTARLRPTGNIADNA